jgi:chemotaxis response regulator CheB
LSKLYVLAKLLSWGWNVSPQKVLLLGRPGLFAQGVQDILERQGDIELCAPCATSTDAAIHIQAFGPDVVVIADEGMTDADLVAHVLRTHPNLPVVCVGLQESVAHVYRSEQVAATSTSLLEAIRGLRGPALCGSPSHSSTEDN